MVLVQTIEDTINSEHFEEKPVIHCAIKTLEFDLNPLMADMNILNVPHNPQVTQTR